MTRNKTAKKKCPRFDILAGGRKCRKTAGNGRVSQCQNCPHNQKNGGT